MTIVLGIATALGWGAADFFGGSSSRRVPVFVVVATSQLISLVVLGPILLAHGVALPLDPRLLLACLAGLGVTLELRLIYLAIGRGQAALTAPTGALGAAIAVIVGVLGGDRLSLTIALGLLCAVSGGGLTAWAARGRSSGSAGSTLPASVGLCLGAAAGLALMLASFHAAGPVDPYWATTLVSLSTFVSSSVAAVVEQRGALRDSLPTRAQMKGLTLVAVAGVAGDLAYAGASRGGALSVVSALSSMYPLTTVGLAATLGGRRPGALQGAGVAVALLGAVLLGGATH